MPKNPVRESFWKAEDDHMTGFDIEVPFARKSKGYYRYQVQDAEEDPELIVSIYVAKKAVAEKWAPHALNLAAAASWVSGNHVHK